MDFLGAPKKIFERSCTTLKAALNFFFAQLGGHGSEFLIKFRQNNKFLDFDTLLKRNGRFWSLEGSKSRPSGLQGSVLRRSGRPRRSWTGSTERSGQQNLIGRFGLAVGVMGPVTPNPGPKSGQSPKSI